MSIVTSILRGGTNNHETTSEEANAYSTDFVTEGIVGSAGNTSGIAPMTGGFAVNEQSSPAMAVDVSSGVAYVTGTPTSQNSQTLRVKNSGTEAVTISANSSGSTKYDWVYIQLDATAMNTPAVGADDVATLVTSRSSSASSDDGSPPTYGYAIAVVTVANGASSITDANIRDERAQVALNTGTSNAVSGWTSLTGTQTVATGYNAGNRSFTIDTTTDQSSVVSEGMRFKVNRGTVPPTQCADLEASSSHYASLASPTGITFTDDFTCEAWIKLESHGSAGEIISRFSSNGWLFRVLSGGRLELLVQNTTQDYITSYQSIPLNKWVHVAGSINASASSGSLYIDGVLVPSSYTNGATTSLTQAGDLTVGARSGGSQFLDGKLADVRVWSDIRTATEIQDNMFAYPSDTTGLVAHFKLNGGFTDASSNSNDLTAQNSAVATNVDNPWNATEYGIITAVSASDIQVQCPEGYGIPNETLTAPFYSTQDTPFGFPRDKSWVIETLISGTSGNTTSSTFANGDNSKLTLPVGTWALGYQYNVYALSGDLGEFTLSTSPTAESDTRYNARVNGPGATGYMDIHRNTKVKVTSQTPYYVLLRRASGSGSGVGTNAGSKLVSIYAECAYL